LSKQQYLAVKRNKVSTRTWKECLEVIFRIRLSNIENPYFGFIYVKYYGLTTFLQTKVAGVTV